MGIRGKTATIVTVIVLALWLAVYSSASLFARRIALESRDADADATLHRVRAFIDHDATLLKSTASDWSQWDESYDFALGRDPSYPANNLTAASLAALGNDFIVLLDLRGGVIAAIEIDSRTRRAMPVSPGLLRYLSTRPRLITATEVSRPVGGLLALPEGVALVAAQPITNSAVTAPKAGTFVIGRFLTRARLDAIGMALLVPVGVSGFDGVQGRAERAAAATARRTGAPAVIDVNADSAAVYSVVRDVDGSSTVVVHATVPRTAEQEAGNALTQASAVMIGFAVVMIFIVTAAIDRQVLRRLERLRVHVRAVRDAADFASRVPVEGNDEISDLAIDINGMLGQLDTSQSDLAYLAAHDSLTRLYNRRRFEVELTRHLADRDAAGALLWIDLDHFKEVNDSLGHAAGDDLLVQIANELAEHTRGSSLLARLGGDEFGVLMPGTDPTQAVSAARRLLDTITGHSFEVAHRHVRVGASIGIVHYPQHGSSVDDLLARADLAMYHAKDRGRRGIAVYTSDDEWRTEMTERIELAESIVQALRDDRFVLHAQPTLRLSDGTAGPWELLVRLVEPDGTIVMPDGFIPVAERLGLIRDIDRWVVRHAIELLAAEERAGRDTRYNVNLSGAAFSDAELLGIIRETIDRTGLDPSRLTIEITETTAINDVVGAQSFIAELKSIGCRFSLDDFGSGSSSFYYLKHLDVDFLKIDGGLIRNLRHDTTDEHFVRAIVEMCKGLQIETVAEYVEDETLCGLVRDRGVDYAQGWGVGRAEPLAFWDLAEHGDDVGEDGS